MREELVVEKRGPDGKLQYRQYRYHYTPTEIAIAKSRLAFKQTSLLAAQVMEALIADHQGGVLKSEKVGLDETAKALVSMVTNATIEPLEKAGLLGPTKYTRPVSLLRSVPAQDDPNDMGDATDAGNPPRKKAKGFDEQVRLYDHLQQPGAEPQPHLDAHRALLKPKWPLAGGTAGGSDGISKALEREGFTYVERSAEGDHWIHGDLKHEVIVRADDFLMKSGWSGETLRGTEVSDVALALTEMDT